MSILNVWQCRSTRTSHVGYFCRPADDSNATQNRFNFLTIPLDLMIDAEAEEFASIIASIDLARLEELALTTRRKLFNGLPLEISCTASTPPRAGSYNIVYELSFSDGIKWAIRIPAEGDVCKPSRIRSLYLDIVAQRFISSRTSIPIPQIYYWSPDSSNILSRPFVIMDFIPGTNLSNLWNDRNWITDQKREKIFEQIAGWMTELSALEFDQIGCLDWDEVSGAHQIVPFPDSSLSWCDCSGKTPKNRTPLQYLQAHLTLPTNICPSYCPLDNASPIPPH